MEANAGKMQDLRWDRNRLNQLAQEKLRDYLFVVVSNREPYIHNSDGNKISWVFGPGGVTAALDPLMQASGGTWVAWGAGVWPRIVGTFGRDLLGRQILLCYQLRQTVPSGEREALQEMDGCADCIACTNAAFGNGPFSVSQTLVFWR